MFSEFYFTSYFDHTRKIDIRFNFNFNLWRLSWAIWKNKINGNLSWLCVIIKIPWSWKIHIYNCISLTESTIYIYKFFSYCEKIQMLSKYYKKWDDFCKSALMLVIIWGKTLLNLFATTWNVFTIIKAQLKRKEILKLKNFILFFLGLGAKGDWLAAGELWFFFPLPLWSSFRSDSKSNFWS